MGVGWRRAHISTVIYKSDLLKSNSFLTVTGDQTNRNSIIKRSGTCGIFPFTCTRRHVIVPQSMTAVEATERLLKGREFVRKRQHLKSTTPWNHHLHLVKQIKSCFVTSPLFVFSLSPDWLNLYLKILEYFLHWKTKTLSNYSMFHLQFRSHLAIDHPFSGFCAIGWFLWTIA